MKKLIPSFIAFFALNSQVLAFGPPNTNSDQSPYVAPADAPVPQQGAAVGYIDLVDQVKQLIRVQDQQGHQLSFYLDGTTPLYDYVHRQLSFNDLRLGDPVAVDFQGDSFTVNQLRRLRG